MTKTTTNQDIDQLMNKIKKMEAGHELDLSSDEDLSIAVMNLISIEEHLFFTAQKTENEAYYGLLFEVREMRKNLLKMLIKEYEGEVWCISKHLLAASMRLMEVGTKAMTSGKDKQASDFFNQAWNLYNLFWALNLKMIDKDAAKVLSRDQKTQMLEEMAAEQKSATKTVKVTKPNAKTNVSNGGFFGKLGNTIGKALDCCRE